jgi:hypothetical protein
MVSFFIRSPRLEFFPVWGEVWGWASRPLVGYRATMFRLHYLVHFGTVFALFGSRAGFLIQQTADGIFINAVLVSIGTSLERVHEGVRCGGIWRNVFKVF